MASSTLTASGFLFRWMAALVLVLGTYNPTPYNFVVWVADEASRGEQLPLKLLIAAVMIIGYVIYFRATFQSIGFIGIGLALLFFGGMIWLLLDYGILNVEESGTMAWVVLFIVATIMAVGLSWSFIRRMLSGQIDQT